MLKRETAKVQHGSPLVEPHTILDCFLWYYQRTKGNSPTSCLMNKLETNACITSCLVLGSLEWVSSQNLCNSLKEGPDSVQSKVRVAIRALQVFGQSWMEYVALGPDEGEVQPGGSQGDPWSGGGSLHWEIDPGPV